MSAETSDPLVDTTKAPMIEKTSPAKTEKVVVLTDSYGDSQCSEVDLLPLLQANGCNVSQFWCRPGGGFNAKYGTFAWEENLINHFYKDAFVTQVIVIGGFNDIYNGEINEITSNTYDFLCRAHTMFPNAKIKLCFVGKSPSYVAYDEEHVSWYPDRYVQARNAWYNATTRCGYAYYVSNSENVLNDSDFWWDDVHPNKQGSQKIANKVANIIKNDIIYM